MKVGVSFSRAILNKQTKARQVSNYVVTPGFVTLYSLAAFTVREERAEVRAFTDQTAAINWLPR